MYLSEEINLAGSSVDTPYIVMFVGAFGLLLFSVSHFHCQPIFKLLHTMLLLLCMILIVNPLVTILLG